MRIGRKAEWLKGDGKAYINTINAFQGIEIKSKFKVNELLNAQYHGVMGFLSYSALFLDGGISVVADRRNNKLLFSLSVVGDNTQNGPSFELGKPVDFEFKNNCYYINDDVIDSKNTKIDNLVIPIFTRIIYPSNISTSKSSIAFFEIVGKISLEPIMLTSDIPYTLASDNLPHAAGECGMWDSVNEKFYGNANSTGAFSVENELDEYVEVDLTGICINGKYQRVAVENSEIQQIVWNGVNARMLMLNGEVVWLINKSYTYLIGEGAGRYINLGQYDISKIVMSIELLKTEKVKTIFFYLNATNLPNYCQIYEQVESGKLKNLMLFRNSGMSHIFDNKLQQGVNVIDIYFNSSNNPAITLNGTTYTNTANKITSFITNVRTQGCIKLITIDNLHFVPKMLLKPLPAESDSQGIARQPCTCGLWCEEQQMFYTTEDGQGLSVI